MKSSTLRCCVVTAAVLCTLLVTYGNAQRLTQAELENLREYLQSRGDMPPEAPSVLDSEKDTYGAAETQGRINQAAAADAELTRSLAEDGYNPDEVGSEVVAQERYLGDEDDAPPMQLEEMEERDVGDDPVQTGDDAPSMQLEQMEERDVGDDPVQTGDDAPSMQLAQMEERDIGDDPVQTGDDAPSMQLEQMEERDFGDEPTQTGDGVDVDPEVLAQRWISLSFGQGSRKIKNSKSSAQNNTALLQLPVLTAEQFRYDGGQFYNDFGVVVTLEDGRRLLIRKNGFYFRFRTSSRYGGYRSGRRGSGVRISSADDMTKRWELVTSKKPTASTVGDYVKVCKAAATRKAAAEAMMKLE